ncbi:uncharacterized protein [Acropora muricata]|uniref:uncharacterized protein n=1 Tax=Acropora muricata TaxID=159855 RepID=UPI0034E55DA8
MSFPVLLPKFNRYSLNVKQNYKYGLLPQQLEALHCLEEWFQQPNPRNPAVVSMPTGSGKTGILCCLPFTLGGIGLQPSLDNNNFPTGVPRYPFDRPVLVIAPGVQIADQLQQQIHLDPFLVCRKIIPDEFKRDVLPKVYRINEASDLQKARFLGEQDVVLANAQKFRGEWEIGLPNDVFRLVIVDEAHHYPAPTWRRIVEKFQQHALVVFVTATPYRMDRKFVVPDRAFAYYLSLERAVERRIIRPTELDLLRFQPNRENEVSEDEIYRQVLERVNQKQQNKNRAHPLPNNIPHMAMAITKTTKEAARVENLWNEAWGEGSALSYYSELSDNEKKQRMGRIRNNQVKLVVVVAMLLEGFDHPPVSIAAILTNIESAPKFAQFIGRAQRISRSQATLEDQAIHADIVSHEYYDRQEENYRRFISEELIGINDEQ